MLSPQAGDYLPTLALGRTALRQMVEWAAATDDFTEFHYDAAAATELGFAGPVVHGPLKAAVLARLLEETFGVHGAVIRLACRYVAVDVVGGLLFAGGQVVSIDGPTVRCELWVRDSNDRTTVRAEAEVALTADLGN